MSKKINFTSEEENKSRVINLVIEKKITNGEAAKQLGMSVRQIKRLKNKVATEGVKAVIHGLKGKTSNHQIDLSIKETVLTIVKDNYPDFKPGFAAEKLAEFHEITISSQTLRLWMTEAHLWKQRKHKKTGQYRSWRPRKEYYGEMQQFDGSYHLWFEDRYKDHKGSPIEVCLLLSIDDATGKITKAQFTTNEGVIAVFGFWKSYVLVNGKPTIIYLDKFSTYKINHKSAEDNKELMTQFGRACNELNIQLIHANSAEAKGRVERCFQTLQDRLVKEMRLANINTPEEGNIFLKEIFIPKFNEKFAVTAAKEGNVHRGLMEEDRKNINRIFSVQSERTINNDFTIQFKTNWYQLQEIQPTTIRPQEKVTVEEWLDGTLHFNLKGYELNYISLPERPPKQKTNPTILTSHKLNYRPPANHPWKQDYSDNQ